MIVDPRKKKRLNFYYENLFVLFNLQKIGNFKTTCNFDVSMCGFVQGINDKFDWTRHKGSTPSRGTGPSFDHTTGNLTGELLTNSSVHLASPTISNENCNNV